MSDNNAKNYYIIDGNSYIYRAFFAVPKFTTRDGQMTNAIYGFAKMLLKLLRNNDHDHVVVAFDHKKPSFRSEMYAEYKANRESMPDELRSQIPLIHRLVELLELPTLVIEGVEADDAIASFVTQTNGNHKHTFYVVTGDKDMMQLVTDNVYIYDTMKEITYDRDGVKKKMGVYPEQIADLLGMMGDTSDNIPGIKGVGPKTAVKLLETYGTLEDVLAHTDEQKGKLKERLIEHKDDAILSKKLATVVKDIDLSHISLDLPEPKLAEVMRFCTELEFFSLKKELEEVFGSVIEETVSATEAMELPSITETAIANIADLQKICVSPITAIYLDDDSLTLAILQDTKAYTIPLVEPDESTIAMAKYLAKHLSNQQHLQSCYDYKGVLTRLSTISQIEPTQLTLVS